MYLVSWEGGGFSFEQFQDFFFFFPLMNLAVSVGGERVQVEPAGGVLSISKIVGYIKEKFNAASLSSPSHKSLLVC